MRPSSARSHRVGLIGRSDRLAAAIVALLTFATFASTLGGRFLAWDDQANFLTNPFFRGFTAANVRWMWTTHLLGHYVPLSWMSLALDYTLWGLNPIGYHLTNVLLHSVSAVAGFYLLRRIFGAIHDDAHRPELPLLAATFGALFFALHPLRVESVAWITERRDVLSLALALVSTLAFFEAQLRPERRRYYAISVIAFACALLAKASVVALPLGLLVLAVYPMRWIVRDDGRIDTVKLRHLLVRLAPFFALALLAGIASVVALEPGPQLPLAKKIGVTLYAFGFYITKTVVPWRLAALYEMPPEFHPLSPHYLAAYGVGLLVIALTAIAARRKTGVAVAVALFVLISLPTLGIVQNGPTLAADRYTYHGGLALAALAGAAFLMWPRATGPLLVGASAVVLALTALSVKQVTYWHDSTALWSRVLDVDSTSAMAHNSLGVELAEQGQSDAAMREYARALELNHRFADPHNNLGYELAKIGRVSDAIAEFQAALAIQPRMVDAEVNWGNVLYGQGQFAPAIGHYQRAAEIAPTHAGARFNWAMALASERRDREALQQLELAAKLDPSDADTRDALQRLRAIAIVP